MKNNCYALITYGSYENVAHEFIKIDESEKEKFKQYCLDSQKIHGSNGESLELLCFVYDIEVCSKNDYDVYILTVHELQKRIQEDLDRLDEMKEQHYLYRHNVRNWFIKLLEYKWL